jgi:hypothetical protein
MLTYLRRLSKKNLATGSLPSPSTPYIGFPPSAGLASVGRDGEADL